MSLIAERHDSELAQREREQSPGIGTCRRCCRPWITAIHIQVGPDCYQQIRMRTEIGVPEHDTPYTDNRGCFALCEACWSALTIEERLPYYEQLCDAREAMRGEEYPDRARIMAAAAKGL